jgi:hypothetical protein
MKPEDKLIQEKTEIKNHTIALGSIAEIDCEYLDHHGLRLFVVEHVRDYDGTPLYTLSINQFYLENKSELEHSDMLEDMRKYLSNMYEGSIVTGLTEECLKVIK